MKPGRPPTTNRSPGRGGRAVCVKLSAAEHAALVAFAAPSTVAAWMRVLALDALWEALPASKGILTWWLVNPKYPERHFRSIEGSDHGNGYAFWYVNEKRWRWGFAFECGGPAETEAEGKALADAAALAAGYTLTNADGTLTLPPILDALREAGR